MIPVKNSAGKQLYVLFNKTTNTVINANALYPNADPTVPIEGLSPDLEYLPKRTEASPNYDSRYFILVKTEGKNITASTWDITYSTQDKSSEEVAVAVDNAERFELTKHFDVTSINKDFVIVAAALARQQKGLILTDIEQVSLDNLVAASVPVCKNAEKAKALKEQIEAGDKPDLDTGWEKASE